MILSTASNFCGKCKSYSQRKEKQNQEKYGTS